MATIVTRAGKGSALSHTEMDSNFTNLNTDKAGLSGATFTGTVNLTSTFQIGGVAVTSTAAELNALDGITSTVSELNILDGVTSTTAELNILDGVTSTTAELNVLDGITPSTTELNYVNGVTSAIQTQLSLKSPIASPTFTGTPSLPTGTIGITQSASNNSTKLSTTAYADNQAAATLGRWIEIAQVGVGSGTSATLDGMNSDYVSYMVIGADIQRAGSSSPLQMQVRIGSVTQTSANYTINGTSGGTGVNILTLSNTTTESSQFQLLITDPSNTGIHKPITIDGVQGTDCTRVSLAARYEGSTGAVNGLYFYPTSGSFQGGQFTLYGLKT